MKIRVGETMSTGRELEEEATRLCGIPVAGRPRREGTCSFEELDSLADAGSMEIIVGGIPIPTGIKYTKKDKPVAPYAGNTPIDEVLMDGRELPSERQIAKDLGSDIMSDGNNNS